MKTNNTTKKNLLSGVKLAFLALIIGPLATTTNIGYPVTGINKGLSGIYHLPLSILWGCMSRPHTIYLYSGR